MTAERSEPRRRTTTSLSCSLAILIAAFGSSAHAQDGAEVAQPQPAYLPPPPVYTPEVAQPAPAYPPPASTQRTELPPPPPAPPRPLHMSPAKGPTAFERRHHIGGQLGGTGILQAVYRLRALGPLHLEVGMMGVTHGANFSAGILVGAPIGDRWFFYSGFGPGVMFGGYPTPKMGCDPTEMKCPEKFADDFKYLHARVGLGFAFGRPRRQLISFDVGGWYGKHTEKWNDTANNKIEAWETIVMPMAGVSYFFAIH